MRTDRAALVATAHASIVRGSKSFASASRLFDRTTRERVWLLYAWCRRCDDLVDGQDHGGAMDASADVAARLVTVRELTALAFAGKPSGDDAFDALGLVARETGLTVEMANDDSGYGSSSSFSCLVNDCENGISRFALDLVYR